MAKFNYSHKINGLLVPTTRIVYAEYSKKIQESVCRETTISGREITRRELLPKWCRLASVRNRAHL